MHLATRTQNFHDSTEIVDKVMECEEIDQLFILKSERVLNYCHLNNEQCNGNCEKAPCEKRHEYRLKYVRETMLHSKSATIDIFQCRRLVSDIENVR